MHQKNFSLPVSTAPRGRGHVWWDEGKAAGSIPSLAALLFEQTQKQLTKPGNATDPSHFMRTFQGGQLARGKTMTTFHRRPQFDTTPIYKLPSARAAESEDDQMPTENLSELLGRVSENSTTQIDSLVGDFGRLREKLRVDGERIQRDVEAYRALSEQVMQLTKTISESVEKVRASVDRPQGKPEE